MPVIISVSGTSELSREPEQAVLDIEARHQSETKEASVSAVRNAATSLISELKALPTSQLASWKSYGLRTHTQTMWNEVTKRNDIVRHHTSQRIKATFADFELLKRAVAKFASHPHLELSNVSWTLTKDTLTSLERESRQKAVLEALTKAKHYAGALGLDKVECHEIADPETGSTFTAPVAQLAYAPRTAAFALRAAPGGWGSARGGASGDAAEEDTVEVTPEQVKITACVHAKFSAS